MADGDRPATDANAAERITKIGDTDLNGSVTMPDQARLQAHLGQSGNCDDGDLNYDSIVDNTDLAMLQKHLEA
jgi:hypothetical protein